MGSLFDFLEPRHAHRAREGKDLVAVHVGDLELLLSHIGGKIAEEGGRNRSISLPHITLDKHLEPDAYILVFRDSKPLTGRFTWSPMATRSIAPPAEEPGPDAAAEP